MSRVYRTATTNANRRRPRTPGRLLAFIGASAVVFAFSVPAAATAHGEQLPPPQSFASHGLSPQLRNAGGQVRVVISLRANPVLQTASSSALRNALQGRLSAAEERSARRGAPFAQ